MTAKAGIQIQLKSPGCKLVYSGIERDMYMYIMNFEICIGNSMICSDIWHKYHEWYFGIVIRNLKFETILKYHEWYLCQVSLQIMLLPVQIGWYEALLMINCSKKVSVLTFCNYFAPVRNFYFRFVMDE